MYRWLIIVSSVLIWQGLDLSEAEAAEAAMGSPPMIVPSTLATGAPNPMSSSDTIDLYLDVTLNGSDRGIMHFGSRGGMLWVPRDTLVQLGFVIPADSPDPVKLTSLQGLQVDYNPQLQTVIITVPLKLLSAQRQMLDGQSPEMTHASTTPGMVLNYNIFGTESTQGYSSVSAYTDLRAFDNLGVFESTALSQTGYGHTVAADRSVQLDTSWSSSFPSSLLTLTVGDTLTAATSWSRATRIGGIQFGTNFALQPYLVTTPLAQFVGSATLPSQVQLYINGMQRYTGAVSAGQFQLNPIPGISGAGTAQLVLTNALGQVGNYQFSLYSSPQLLQKGLSDWSVELGAVRENYGIDSFDYGNQPVASETLRYGLTNGFTVESHTEATAGLIDVGFGGDLLIGKAGGILSGSIAYSSNHGAGGSQFGLGYSWNNALFNIGFNGIYSLPHYSDVATLYGPPPPELSATATAGVSIGPLGNVGVNYADLQQPQQQASRYAGAYWFKSLSPSISLNLSANQNLDQPSQRSIFLSLNISLDSRTYASASVQNDGSGSAFGVSANRSIPTSGGVGWQVQQQLGGGTDGGFAELDYLGRYGQVQVGGSDTNANDAAYAGATGALVLIGGDGFASRSINSGFAVVSTEGIPNVPVKLENNPIGVTDDDGMLLVTPLNSYQDNHVSIDPMNLPADMEIGRVDEVATPADRAGTMVKFDITRIHAASVVLVDIVGKPLPLGSVVTLAGSSEQPALVGFDGIVYLDRLKSYNVLHVDTPSGACRAGFAFHDSGNSIPQIGPLTCAKKAA